MMYVLKGALMRQGAALTSTHIGELRQGTTVEVLETAVNPANGVVRVRCEEGWVSTTSSGGEMLLVPVDATPPQSAEHLQQVLDHLRRAGHAAEARAAAEVGLPQRLRNHAVPILVFLLVATALGVGLKTQYGGGGGGSSAKKKRSKRRRVRRT
jgi:hypothetical protein